MPHTPHTMPHTPPQSAERSPGNRPRILGVAYITTATLAVLLLLRPLASAQDVTEPNLKAAFVYHFAKFTEWPARLPLGEPFVMCVVGDAAIRDALERTVKDRLVAAHAILVWQMDEGPPRVCHVMYLSGLTIGKATALITGLRDAPVLTLSDIDGFTEMGGIAQFFFEHGQLRFRVNRESAKRAGLEISSRLLQLAK
jgi:hypothetical protein